MSNSTAVFPSKYYFEELKSIDPRFYVEKDIIVIVPYEMSEAPPPEQAIVMKTSVISKTYIITQEIALEQEIKT